MSGHCQSSLHHTMLGTLSWPALSKSYVAAVRDIAHSATLTLVQIHSRNGITLLNEAGPMSLLVQCFYHEIRGLVVVVAVVVIAVVLVLVFIASIAV